MKKQLNIVIGISAFLCFLLLVSIISFNLKETNAVNLVKNEERNAVLGNYDYRNSFDVSDFAITNVSTIDIAAKKYEGNKVSVRDSDFVISEELMAKIDETIKGFGASSSFYIVGLDGMSIGYNVDRKYETASSIKAPYALYIYEEIAKGNIDGERKLTYESRFYNKGTGVIKNSDPGTEYTVRELVYYSLHESDNVAHMMLHKTFGVKGYNKMLKNLGTKELYLTASNPWGYTSCRSAAIVWQEMLNFSIKDTEGITFFNILSNGKYNYFKEVMPTIPSASKTGFANRDVVETGIVFDKTPYIAIAMANKGGSIGAYTQVLKLINVMNDIMNEYNAFKGIK